MPASERVRLWCTVCILSLTVQQALAQSATDLDLGSQARTQAPDLPAGTSVSYQSGGQTRSVGSGDVLTTAEKLVVQQILNGGSQTLQLSAQGNATGGSLQLTPQLTGQSLGDLVIPHGVTVTRDFAAGTPLALSGTLNNAGSFYAYSSNSSITQGVISANSIVNHTGAIISSVLPAGILTGLPTVSNFNLTVTAVNDIINGGSITSSGSLNIIAGGSIVNASTAAMQPVMQAVNNLTMQANNIVNAGVLAAANINITNLTLTNLVLNNTGGRLEALAGVLDVRAALQGQNNISIFGGDLVARQIDLTAANGHIGVNVGLLEGKVNLTGCEAHIQANTPNLQFGQVNLSGDPAFINAGNLLLPTSTAGQPYIAVAGGNITVAPGFNLDTSSSSSDGGNILLVAGAQATLNSGLVTITGRSGLGGDIDLTGIATINSSSQTSSGGSFTAIAFAQAPGSSTGGHVLIPASVIIQSGGSGSGSNGSLTVLAEAQGTVGVPDSISIGGANSTSATAGAAAVNLRTISPNITPGNPLVISATTGNPVAGTPTAGPVQTASISSGDISVRGNDIQIVSGNNITTGAVVAAGASQGSGNIQMTSLGTINLTRDVTASGLLSLSAQTGILGRDFVAANIPVGNTPLGVAVTPDGRMAYVADFGSNSVSVIDTKLNTRIATIPVGAGPRGIAVSPDGLRVYVTNSLSNTVSVIDRSTNSTTATIAVPSGPTGVTFNSSGTLAFVASSNADLVTFIDTATNTVSGAPVAVQSNPLAIAFNASNSKLYVGNRNSNSVSVIDPQTRTVNNSAVSFSPQGFGPCPCGTKIFVSDGVSGVHVFSTETDTVLLSIPLPAGSAPQGIGINPTGSLAYVANAGNGTVSIITTLTNQINNTVTVGASPQVFGEFAAFVNDHAVAYVSDSAANQVSVVRAPLLTAAQYNFSSNSGPVNVVIGSTPVTASSTNGSVILTSAQSINSNGGTSKEFQLASPSSVTVNGPINADFIDLHAIKGAFTNNSTITSNGTLLFVAAPVNNILGPMIANNAGGAALLALQAPSGVLSVTAGPNGTLSSTGAGNTGLIFFNPAGGTQTRASGPALSANLVNFGGNTQNHTIDAQFTQINGIVNLNKSPTSVYLQNTTGNLTLGAADLTAPGSSLTVLTPAGNLTTNNVKATSVNLFSGGNINMNGSTNTVPQGLLAGSLNIQAPQGIVSQSAGAPAALAAVGPQGGLITLVARSFQLDATNANGSSIDASGTAGSGGLIQMSSASNLTVGTAGPGSVAGSILSNGVNGGGIRIGSPVLTVSATGLISGDGTIGIGGFILLSGTIPLVVTNNGLIRATNTAGNAGIVAFSSTPNGAVTLSGTGTVTAGGFASFGNLNPLNGTPVNQSLILQPSANVNLGTISLQQGIPIGNVIVIGQESKQSALSQPPLPKPPEAAIVSSVVLPQVPDNATIPTDRVRISFATPSSTSSLNPVKGQNLINVVAAISSLDSFSNNSQAGMQVVDSQTLSVTSGKLLLTPVSDLTINSPHAQISIKAGAVVFLNVSDNFTAVYDLWDDHLGDVKVKSASLQQILAPGAFFSIGNTAGNSAHEEKLPLRNLTESRSANNMVCQTAEFSLPTAIAKIATLNKTLTSTSAADKRLLRRLLKGAAALTFVHPNRQVFTDTGH